VRSVIIEPEPGRTVRPGDIMIRGVAWSGAAAIARVEANPPAPLKNGSKEDDDRVVADLQRKALYVTAFGRKFYEACEYRPDPGAR